MKITTLLLLFTILQSTANVLSQTISVDVRNQSMRDVLRIIETQTGYRFFYNDQLSGLNTPVTIKAENKSLEEVLNQLLDKQQFSYTAMENKMIVIVPKEFMQQRMITGVITDTDGQPLPGVNVVVKGTTIGTITGPDGQFRIDVPPDAQTLVFSFIGMKTQEIDITDKILVNVILEQEAFGIDEVVAIGYGVTQKATLTGSIHNVKGDIVARSPVLNVSTALSGHIPGLTVINLSGEPGQDGALLRIRGLNTLNDNNPLIVVDGIANRDINRLNPADIESITVLKDASAAIYGSQAANGVILVTTKRGTEKGKSEVNITVNQGWGKPVVIPKKNSAAEFAEAYNQFYGDIRYTEAEIQKFRDGSDPWLYPDHDYFSMIYKNYAPQTHAHASVRGGSEDIAYYVSLGYRFQDAIYKNSNTNFSQLDFRTNLDGKISKNITLNLDLLLGQRNENQPHYDKERVWERFVRASPIENMIWPNGLVGPHYENPFILTTEAAGYNRLVAYELKSNVRLNVDLPWIEGLSISGNASVDKDLYNQRIFAKAWTVYNWDKRTYDEYGQPVLEPSTVILRDGGSDPNLRINRTNVGDMTLNTLINYSRRFSNVHNIGALVGIERNTGKTEFLTAYRRYFPSPALDELVAGGDAEKDCNGNSTERARLNYFGRFNYNFAHKYMIELLFRYDGSYMFPRSNRYGFFPGVSIGWNIAEEEFWANLKPLIPYAKLRGSYGKTGNDRIDEFQYLGNYGFVELREFGTKWLLNENVEVATLGELRVPNPNITWEVANQFNIGLDASLSKLSITFDYFHYYRNNILIPSRAAVPVMAGFTLPLENIGEVVNRGFDFQIGYNSSIGKFSYGVLFNGGYSKNKIKFWDEEPGVPDYQKSTDKPIDALLLYEAIGIFRDWDHVNSIPSFPGAQPGDIIFKDVNGDEQITDLDMVRQSKAEVPVFAGGITLNLSYGNLYSTILVQGVAGARRLLHQRTGPSYGWFSNDLKDRWTPDNPDAKKPRPGSEGIYWDAYQKNNTFFLDNSSYMRIKNMEIGYNLRNIRGFPGNARIYISAQNIFTLDYLVDYDPETEGGHDTFYPQNKVFNIGISLTF